MTRAPAVAALFGVIIGLGGGIGGYWWLTRQSPSHVGAVHHIHAGDGCCPSEAAEPAHAAKEHPEEEDHNEGEISLTKEAMSRFGVEVAIAKEGVLETTLSLPGEIVLNADRVAHILPRVSGIVVEVRKGLGDKVAAGEVMAVLDSRELAEAKSADLAAEARLALAEATFKRIDDLREKKVVSDRDYQEAKYRLEEVRIEHRATEARLHALGLIHDQVINVGREKQSDFSRYEIKAPFDGTVVEKHLTLGEAPGVTTDIFTVADLSTVWIDVTVYPQYLNRLQLDAQVRVVAQGASEGGESSEGRLFFVSPTVRETTRTGLARAILANPDGRWRPGLFVTAHIVVGREQVAVMVPSEAVQRIGNRSTVFVENEGRFQVRHVTLGRQNNVSSEVLSGLAPGERYAATGAFLLKAELSKGAGGHEH